MVKGLEEDPHLLQSLADPLQQVRVAQCCHLRVHSASSIITQSQIASCDENDACKEPDVQAMLPSQPYVH